MYRLTYVKRNGKSVTRESTGKFIIEKEFEQLKSNREVIYVVMCDVSDGERSIPIRHWVLDFGAN